VTGRQAIMPAALHTRVFLGPTLSHAEARAILDVEYQPPITTSDLDRAMADGVDVIGIIDAAFLRECTATPTQIVACLRRGVVMYGAASAGALRAVETERFGMRGVGGIFELFRSGFEAEDELAVSYDPDTMRALSEAMINVRYAATQAMVAGILSQAGYDAVIAVGKAIYFADRTYRLLFDRVRGRLPAAELEAFSRFVGDHGDRLNWKRADAVLCLKEMGRYLAQAEARLASESHPEHL
jgi:hypothetical protein